MRIKKLERTVLIFDLPTLNARTAAALASQTRASLPAEVDAIEIDLSQTDSIDSQGLGILVALFRTLHHRLGRAVVFRLLDPAPPAQQLIELTRLHHLFEIVHRESTPPQPLAPAPLP